MAKILFIIAHRDYQDKEFLDTKKELEGNTIEVASSEKTTAKGVLGGTYTPDLTTKEALENVDEYDAMVLVGGGGAQQYFEDETVHKIIKRMNSAGKIVAAICISPKTLALTGILRGKKATVWDPGDRSVIKEIEEKGAIYTGENVTVDGNIITANGPHAATEFGKTIKKKLEK
ncbi:DJ-1 family protein [Candidatus Woesearchaeota archaeon]|nr:MAG: DJ-1 family protein [Candidatus Woesearchaeota archaeon]